MTSNLQIFGIHARAHPVSLDMDYNDPGVTPPDELTLDVCMSIPKDAQGGGEVATKFFPGVSIRLWASNLTARKNTLLPGKRLLNGWHYRVRRLIVPWRVTRYI